MECNNLFSYLNCEHIQLNKFNIHCTCLTDAGPKNFMEKCTDPSSSMICDLEKTLGEVLSSILQTEMKIAYGDLWTEVIVFQWANKINTIFKNETIMSQIKLLQFSCRQLLKLSLGASGSGWPAVVRPLARVAHRWPKATVQIAVDL